MLLKCCTFRLQLKLPWNNLNTTLQLTKISSWRSPHVANVYKFWSSPWYIIICPRSVQLQVRQANKYSAFLSTLQGTKASPNTQAQSLQGNAHDWLCYCCTCHLKEPTTLADRYGSIGYNLPKASECLQTLLLVTIGVLQQQLRPAWFVLSPPHSSATL